MFRSLPQTLSSSSSPSTTLSLVCPCPPRFCYNLLTGSQDMSLSSLPASSREPDDFITYALGSTRAGHRLWYKVYQSTQCPLRFDLLVEAVSYLSHLHLCPEGLLRSPLIQPHASHTVNHQCSSESEKALLTCQLEIISRGNRVQLL